ncbi:MAG: putative metallopeptidase [Sphaerobacter sp.]|nr:putative metallopeptidase [Sphaerobacter sp.]
MPPEPLREPCPAPELAGFTAAPELERWVRDTFVSGVTGSPMHNPEHAHLALARIGVLWTNAANVHHGRVVLGTAEMPDPKGTPWQRARQWAQLREWFGEVPDFVITLSAPYAAGAGDAEFCALIEHELYHCAQAVDEYGAPRFSRVTGLPIWAIRGHDVEQFIGVVRRYGADAAGVRQLVEAASQPALLPAATIAGACGTCLVRAA